MNVLVLGAGVVGTTTAWYLCRAGHHVTVVERQDGAGLETSFANGGQISPCHSEPWANPSVLPKIIRWLGRADAPLLFHWNRWDPALWAWGLRFLRNCTQGRMEINIERALRVAIYSRSCLRDLRAELGLEYDQKTLGILHVYRDPREFAHACEISDLMRFYGLNRLEKSPSECIALEPALGAVATTLAGGIHTPDDESGDAHKFTQALAEHAARAGVEFRYGTAIDGIEHDRGRVTGVRTSAGLLTADSYILSLGSYSPLLARTLGLRLPIIPAKGYSITVPVEAHHHAPVMSVTDDSVKMVYSRLGNRLRAAGTAEMTGWNTDLTDKRWKLILGNAKGLFPKGGDYARAEPWTGLRPASPDGVPIIGATPYSNLFLNTGHGTLGWTMSCGSARLLADLVSGRQPEIDPNGLGMDRF